MSECNTLTKAILKKLPTRKPQPSERPADYAEPQDRLALPRQAGSTAGRPEPDLGALQRGDHRMYLERSSSRTMSPSRAWT